MHSKLNKDSSASETKWPASVICAHRGASDDFPENTLVAFERAGDYGVGWIETDLQLLSDGRLIIFHDASLGRTSPGSSVIAEMEWTQVKNLDVGGWKRSEFSDQRPLKCEDLIRWQEKRLNSPIIIWEMKYAAELAQAKLAAKALYRIISVSPGHRCIVSSFDREFLKQFRILMPEIPTALLAGILPDDGIKFCKTNGISGIHLTGDRLSRVEAKNIIKEGLNLRCYTINNVAEAKRLMAFGVEVIMTDRPGLFLSLETTA